MIKKVLTYLLVLILLMYSVRYLHYYGLLKQNAGYYGKYKTAFLQTNEFNVIFLGSSRVQMHYNTRLFDSLTGKNSFNLSMAGATPKIAFAALKIYLSKSKAPDDLFYDIDYHFIDNESKEIKDFNNYFPFLSDETVLNELSMVDQRMKMFRYNPFYSLPFCGLQNISTSLHGWFNIPNRTDSLFYKGYFKETLRPELSFISTEAKQISFHPVEKQFLDSIIWLCKSKNINVRLLTSPIFGGGKINVLNKKEVVNSLQSIAHKHDISYNDFSSLPFCNNRQLFVDHPHMNHKGANLFTLYFSEFYNNNCQKNSLNH